MRAFFDTNTLLYAASADPVKALRAEQLIAAGGWISVQVLNEAARVFRAKWRRNWEDTGRFLKRCELAFEVVPLDHTTHRKGLEIAQRYGVSIFDSMIVAAAILAECGILYSEDMHHGLLIDNVLTINNPFRDPS